MRDLAGQRERAAPHVRIGLATERDRGRHPDPDAHPFGHRLGIADRVKRDPLHPGVDKALEQRGRISVAAAPRIVGVIGDDQRLVARLAFFRPRHRLGDREQLEAFVFARLPGVIHEFLGDRLAARRRPGPVQIDRDGHRRPDIGDIGAAEPRAGAGDQDLAGLFELLAAPQQFGKGPSLVPAAIQPVDHRPPRDDRFRLYFAVHRPHIDQYERAWQGAELLERAMNGEVKPKTVIARRPMIYGLDRGRTQKGPMAELIAKGEQLEKSGEALVVSVCAGFSRANIRDVGPSVTVTVDTARSDARPQSQAVAEEYMDYAWETRDYESFTLLSVAEAVARAKLGKPGDKPLVIADYTDNPGGGGYGDATAFLKGLVEAGVEPVAFHAICDPEAVAEGLRAGIGMQTTIAIGGKTDPRMGGGPLLLTGEVTHLTNGKFIAYGPMGGGVERDYGPSMVFRVGGIDIICISNNGQAVDLAQFTSLGIDP